MENRIATRHDQYNGKVIGISMIPESQGMIELYNYRDQEYRYYRVAPVDMTYAEGYAFVPQTPRGDRLYPQYRREGLTPYQAVLKTLDTIYGVNRGSHYAPPPPARGRGK